MLIEDNCHHRYQVHCAKSVGFRSHSGPHFPAFGLNTEFSVSHAIYLNFDKKYRLFKVSLKVNCQQSFANFEKLFVLQTPRRKKKQKKTQNGMFRVKHVSTTRIMAM